MRAEKHGETGTDGRDDAADAGEPAIAAHGLFAEPAKDLADIIIRYPA